MASLKEVRTRIESVKSTQQITSAMKMVSASKLRKAQTVIHGMQPYAKKNGNPFTKSVSAGREPDNISIKRIQGAT